MSVLILREGEVRSLVSIEEALEAVEAAFHEQAQGTGINEPRRRVRQPDGTLHLMGASVTKRGYWGFKAYTTTRTQAYFIVNLYDGQTGRLLSVMEANTLGQYRTGAASGVATKFLANESAEVLALIGAGYQAETQLSAIAAVRSLKAVRVYSHHFDRCSLFAEKMGSRLGLEITPTQSPSEAVLGAHIITTITTASEPVFDGNDIEPGVHINAAGSNSLARRELDRTAVRRADRIVTDDLEQARLESGSLVSAFESNALNWSRVRPLADIVSGLVPGRRNAEEVTLFLSHGIAIWDIALAALVYEKAVSQSAGEVIELGGESS